MKPALSASKAGCKVGHEADPAGGMGAIKWMAYSSSMAILDAKMGPKLTVGVGKLHDKVRAGVEGFFVKVG